MVSSTLPGRLGERWSIVLLLTFKPFVNLHSAGRQAVTRSRFKWEQTRFPYHMIPTRKNVFLNTRKHFPPHQATLCLNRLVLSRADTHRNEERVRKRCRHASGCSLTFSTPADLLGPLGGTPEVVTIAHNVVVYAFRRDLQAQSSFELGPKG